MFEQLIKSGVQRYEEWFVTALIMEDGQAAGVIAMEMRTGELHLIRAKSVILATGGCGRLFEPSTNALIVTGDGMGLVYNAGGQLMDMEMVQYHPTTLAGSGVLISEAARGEGAYLRDKDGNRFMEKYAPNMMELASRDVVSRAEQTEINAGNGVDGCVYLDCTHLGESLIMEKLIQIREIGIDLAGVDMIKEPIPIRPGMHYIMGGIKTDIEGRTNLNGVYAAGECANVSVHGGNRLGANSLLDTIVFGERSGNHAAEFTRNMDYVEFNANAALDGERRRIQEMLDRPENGDRWSAIRQGNGRIDEPERGGFPQRRGHRRNYRRSSPVASPLRERPRSQQGQELQHRPDLRAGTRLHAGLRRHHRRRRAGTQGEPRRPVPHGLPRPERRRMAAPHRPDQGRRGTGDLRTAGHHYQVDPRGEEILGYGRYHTGKTTGSGGSHWRGPDAPIGRSIRSQSPTTPRSWTR